MLIGNKLDLNADRIVKKEESIAWAENHKMQYIETSAKSDENIDKAFNSLVMCINFVLI